MGVGGGGEGEEAVSFLNSASSKRHKAAFNEGRSAKWPSRVRRGQGGEGGGVREAPACGIYDIVQEVRGDYRRGGEGGVSLMIWEIIHNNDTRSEVMLAC